ncbi:MAG TPA: DedA family protein [Acidimicrobiales bacterium]|nr:DedA family protein [Acidimicrobiales bacterium]
MEHFLLSIGYPAIFFLALVEAICIPFPSEVTFGYTGYLASQGKLSLVAIIVVGVLGEFIGSMIAYAIGRSGGRAIIDRYGKYVLLSHRDLDKTDAFMAKYGDPAVLIGRMVPLLRAFISLAAGIGEMKVWRFALFSFIGTAIYCSAMAIVGYNLGGEWHKIVKGFTAASIIVLVLAIVAVVVVIWHRWRSMHAHGAAADQET